MRINDVGAEKDADADTVGVVKGAKASGDGIGDSGERGARMLRLLRTTGAILILAGCGVLLGWGLGIPWLTSDILGSDPIKAGAGLAFVLVGNALFLHARPSAYSKAIGWICILILSLIIVLNFSAQVSALQLETTKDIWNAPLSRIHTDPGWFSRGATASFGIAILALLALWYPAPRIWRTRALAMAGVLIFAISLQVQLRYFESRMIPYTNHTNDPWWYVRDMSLGSSALFIVLSCSFLWSSWLDSHNRWRISRWVSAVFACELILLAVLGIQVLQNTSAFIENIRTLQNLLGVATAKNSLKQMLLRLELRAEKADLSEKEHHAATHEILTQFETLQERVRNAPPLIQDFSSLGPLLQTWIEETRRPFSQEISEPRAGGEIDGTHLSEKLHQVLWALFSTDRVLFSEMKAVQDGATRVSLWNSSLLPSQILLSALFLGYGLLLTNNEISLRKSVENALRWETRTLELLSTKHYSDEILATILRGIEEHAPGVLCALLLVDEDGVHLRPAAAPSLSSDCVTALEQRVLGADSGACGAAALTGKQVVVSDIDSDPRCLSFRSLAADQGIKACCSSPIFGRHKRVIAVLSVFFREARSPFPGELEIIQIGIHITSIALELRQSEDELRNLNVSLENRIQERTQKLETALKELDTFSYSVSHDLRAPLRAIDGFSRILMDEHAGHLNEDGRRMLGVIRSETVRMGRLIDDLLSFSRLGRQNLTVEHIDMYHLALSEFNSLASLEKGRVIQLKMDSLPPAEGTLAMIRQVWINLLANAIKFTRSREVAEIEISAQAGKDGETIYRIKDNGVGFDMRHVGKLFGVFQRLHSEREFEGTGVGLALVSRIINRHGGKIWAEGEVNKGATFFFTLPNQTL